MPKKYKELIDAMGADRQDATADQAGPKQVRASQVEIEMKDLQLVAVRRGAGQLGDGTPGTVNRI